MIETTDDLIPRCWLDSVYLTRIEKLGIYTCQELLEYPDKDFIIYKGFGPTTLAAISDLRSHISRYLNLDSKISADVWSIESVIPKNLIPSSLAKILHILSIHSFHDLDVLELEPPDKNRGLGNKALDDIKAFHDEMHEYISERSRTQITANKVVYAVSLEEYLTKVEYYWSEFKIHVLDNNEQIVLEHYVTPNSPKSLRDIGVYLNLSHERVRQIRDVIFDYVERYFMGGHFSQLDWYLSPEVVFQYTDVLNLIKEKSICMLDEVRNYNQGLKIVPYSQLFALFSAQSLNVVLLSNEQSVISRFSPKELKQLEQMIYRYLKDNQGVGSLFDLTVKIKRNFVGISNELIKNILPLIKGISIVEDEISLDHGMLPRYSDIAVKVLEKEGKPLHYTEIKKRVDEAMVAVGRLPQVDKIGAGPLSQDERLTCAGKTGLWSLSDWRLKPKTAHQTLLYVLEVHKVAMEKNFLLENAISVNTTYSSQTYNAVLIFALDKREILPTIDGRVVHVDHSSKYDIQPYNSPKRVKHIHDFDYWLYEVTNTNPLNMEELWNSYPLSGNTSFSGFKVKVYNCKELIRIDNGKESLKYQLLHKPECSKPTSKYEQVENDLFDILDENNGKIMLIEAITILKKNGHHPQSSYGVVEKSQYFKTEFGEDSKREKYLTYISELM